MLYAVARPEPEKGGRGKTRTDAVQVSRNYLGRARAVVREAADLVDQVIVGTYMLTPLKLNNQSKYGALFGYTPGK
jgi:hypothetical protein